MSSLAEFAEARRSRNFVGRAAELTVLTRALGEESTARPIVYVHGPGGVGKTALLETARRLAEGGGRCWIWVDASTFPPTLPLVEDAVAPAVDGRTTPVVLVVDGYEHLAHLDAWFGLELLPRLPRTTVVILASRRPPPVDWLVSPVLAPLLEIVPLRNLGPKESQELLDRLDVDPTLHDAALAATHGHPLALHLVAEQARRSGAVDHDPGRTAALLRALVGDVPDDRHRRTLEVCALARVTTEDLLRAALDEPDVGDLFAWLRDQCYVQSGPEGLHPHDVARDALDADLSWRDPERYHSLFRSVSRFLIRRLHETRGGDQQRAILDVKFMHRYHPVSRGYADWATFGQSYAEPAARDEIDEVVRIIEHWQGSEAAHLARRWHGAQPRGFFVVRHRDRQAQGTVVAIDLSEAPPDLLRDDPVAAAGIEAVGRGGGLRPGERVTMVRFVADREAYQDPSPTLNVGPVLSIQHYLTTPGLTADVLVLADTGQWDEYFDFFEIRKVRAPSVQVGGMPYALFVRDFRAIPVDDWLQLMLDRDLSGAPTPLTSGEIEVVALAREAFDSAVRDALRDLRRPDRLASNPLARSRVVVRGGTADDLATVLRAAIAALAEDPRSAKQARALEATYLRGALTQERAAELLDLPMTTYKRHLRQGHERVADVLWARELGAI